MATYVEPIGSGKGTFGPFEDELEASQYMDDHRLTDAEHKIVVR